ncbi:MAG TPA: ADP-forming succinate--CoA ligase subunit beta [Candidatus Limnocylindria bacterium]|nr:ADP-forming succinate--CoA ligase subunit beta [Candidatus Limnocylindria bacterium]
MAAQEEGCVKLQEYRSKEILARHGVPLLRGQTATSPTEARAAAMDVGGRVVVKAQVLVGGRGKAGGVKLAADPNEAEQHARDILGMDIKGVTVKTVLVVPAAEIEREFYLSLILDRARRAVTVIASAEGGVEIEETARTNPEAVLRLPLHPLLGLQDHNIRRVSFFLGIPAELRSDFVTVMRGLHAAFLESDADLAEINPLVITGDGRLLALDAKIVLDDSALVRHPDLEAMRDLNEEEPSEIAAREAGINFIKLDGSIGCMVNGAGLAMTTMDLIKLYGGEPANFLDIGGGARADRVEAAFRIILADRNVKAILINIFGGITRGDEVARGIVEARRGLDRDVPMVVRIVGTNAPEAQPILAEANLITALSLDEAAQKAVAAVAAGTAGTPANA